MKNVFSLQLQCRILLAIPLLLLLRANAQAVELITATHTLQRDGGIVLQLAVADPPPASVIVSLHLSSSAEIVHARPAVKKYNPKKNQAKWLLKDLTPGGHTITYELSPPLSPDQVDCVIQYRDPRNGRIVNQKVPLTASR